MGRSTTLRKASRIRLLLFDVDGVLTDGTILVHADGSESKRFHVRDGTAIVWAHRAGLLTGGLTARPSLVRRRSVISASITRASDLKCFCILSSASVIIVSC